MNDFTQDEIQKIATSLIQRSKSGGVNWDLWDNEVDEKEEFVSESPKFRYFISRVEDFLGDSEYCLEVWKRGGGPHKNNDAILTATNGPNAAIFAELFQAARRIATNIDQLKRDLFEELETDL